MNSKQTVIVEVPDFLILFKLKRKNEFMHFSFKTFYVFPSMRNWKYDFLASLNSESFVLRHSMKFSRFFVERKLFRSMIENGQETFVKIIKDVGRQNGIRISGIQTYINIKHHAREVQIPLWQNEIEKRKSKIEIFFRVAEPVKIQFVLLVSFLLLLLNIIAIKLLFIKTTTLCNI